MAQGCASGWESQVANATNCFMFMPDDHKSWDAAQVIACKYYLKEIQLLYICILTRSNSDYELKCLKAYKVRCIYVKCTKI